MTTPTTSPPVTTTTDMNLVVIHGTLATPPEHRVGDDGSGFTRLLVTVRTTHPRRRVDVIPVVHWLDHGAPVDALIDAQRGDRVWITGAMQRRFWDAQDGRRSRIEVVAEQVTVSGEASAPATCVLVGADGENADDCTTHDHEEDQA